MERVWRARARVHGGWADATTSKRCYRVSVHRAPALTADRAETFTASVSVNRRGACRFYLLASRPRWNPPKGVAATQRCIFLPNVAIYRRAQDWTLENNTIDNGHGMVFVETGSPVTFSFKSSPGSEDSQEFSSLSKKWERF